MNTQRSEKLGDLPNIEQLGSRTEFKPRHFCSKIYALTSINADLILMSTKS